MQFGRGLDLCGIEAGERWWNSEYVLKGYSKYLLRNQIQCGREDGVKFDPKSFWSGTIRKIEFQLIQIKNAVKDTW